MTILIPVGLNYPKVKVCASEYSPLLAELAQNHADYMAHFNKQGHQNFDTRHRRVLTELGLHATEICAETWPWQANATSYEVATEMYDCWLQSPGHWRVVADEHALFGDGLAKSRPAIGRPAIWYACILTADTEAFNGKKTQYHGGLSYVSQIITRYSDRTYSKELSPVCY